MSNFLLDLAYVFICHLGWRCRRDFNPHASCSSCGRSLKQTLHGKQWNKP